MDVNRPRLSFVRGGAVVFLSALMTACSGPSGAMRKEVNGLIAARDFAGAESRIQKEKEAGITGVNGNTAHRDVAEG